MKLKLLDKQFIRDKVALSLMGGYALIVFSWSVIIILRLIGNKGTESYFIEYRPIVNSVAQYQQGGIFDVVSFIVFLWVILFLSVFIASRTYSMKKQLSRLILGYGLLLTIFTVVVSNALLVLH